MSKYQAGQYLLLVARKAGHIRILEHIGAVPMVVRMGNIQTKLMQASSRIKQ